MDGRRLRQLRDDAGLTQLQLAAKAKLSLTTITDIEQGRLTNPKLATLEALARALQLDPGDLLADPEPEPNGERVAS